MMNLDNDFQVGSGVVFGADIGTTNSYIAYCEHGKAKVPNAISRGIPSIAWRDKYGNEWFCDEVENKGGLIEDPANVWISGKTKLGDKRVILGGCSYTPRYLMEKMVGRILKVCAEAIMEEAFIEMKPEYLVIGIPVRFTAAEKAEMQDIVNKCLNVKIILVPEPVLAAIYYDDCLTHMRGSSLKKDRKVMVIDSGGGTTDIAVLTTNPGPDYLNPEPYITHYPAGVKKAGDCIDGIMEEILLEKVRQNPGNIRMDIIENTDHADRRRLRYVIAREAKERLSSVNECTVDINGLDCGSTSVKVTRAEFEYRIRPVIKEFIDIAENTYKKCGFDENTDIDFLLVGGTTNIPLFKQMIKERFPFMSDEKILSRNPAMAVALGAAIYAQNPDIVNSKVAFGYGVNTHVNGSEKEMLRVMIPSVTRLPFTVTSKFTPYEDGQTSASFTVYEVYGADEKATYIELDRGRMTPYRIVHHFNRQVPKSTEILLTLTLTEDGALNAMVEDFLPDKHVYRKTFMLNGTSSC